MATEDREKGELERNFTIVVNGRERTVTEKRQSYRAIVRLAYPDPNFDQFLYVIPYFKGEGEREGDLSEGETVRVENGMVFNVRRSDKS